MIKLNSGECIRRRLCHGVSGQDNREVLNGNRFFLRFVARSFHITAIAIFIWTADCAAQKPKAEEPPTLLIPVQGNSWVWDEEGAGRQGEWNPQENLKITREGAARWSSPSTVVATWFKTASGGKLKVSLRARSTSGESVMKLRYDDQEQKVTVPEGMAFTDLPVVTFQVKNPGYQRLELQGVTREGDVFAEVAGVLIGGEAAAGKVWFVRDEFYWGQRGPSVHLSYTVPAEAGDVRWFYNEVTIPSGEDVIGSYFMANGFAEGYFGIQVNSATERRILFSVWSPYSTDDPREIPEDQQIKLLRKGEGVTTGEFGNEGSGGQSYLVYPWKAGVTYSFLLEAIPASARAEQENGNPDVVKPLFGEGTPVKADTGEVTTVMPSAGDRTSLKPAAGEETTVMPSAGEGTSLKPAAIGPSAGKSGITKPASPKPAQGATRYTAWFREKGSGSWRLIASFSRPQTTTWVMRPHSFLENFIPEAGQYTRKGHYGNQWAVNSEGKWFELTEARFTVDNTGRKEARMDFSGGVEEGRFFLKNCGFFNELTPAGSCFTRPPSGEKPEVDFNRLP
jgi:hypothetical protein